MCCPFVYYVKYKKLLRVTKEHISYFLNVTMYMLCTMVFDFVCIFSDDLHLLAFSVKIRQRQKHYVICKIAYCSL